MARKRSKFFIQKAIKPKNRGALRAELHAKSGENIPVSKLEKASHASGKLGKRARFALLLKRFHHGGRRKGGSRSRTRAAA